ncbi:hypothetical protein OE88DRAFT_1213709 [Heliocybe sulcata]|uniref:Uncharacterized protein n=1 Tax=Heliocybe sulcata TaxID=5364 RepID=A0A5C3MMD8_9AGAM|nr:hypothetical protein OE88DRAFT_1213709 [Heliocybe sulcata]
MIADGDAKVPAEGQKPLPRFSDQSHQQPSLPCTYPFTTSSPLSPRPRSSSIPLPTIVITSPCGTSHTYQPPSVPAKIPRARPQPPTVPDPTRLSWIPWVSRPRSCALSSCQSRSPSPASPTTQCQVGTANRVRTRPAGRMGRARSDSFYGGRPIIATGPIPSRRPRFEGGVTVDIGSIVVADLEVKKVAGAQIGRGGLPTPPQSPDQFEFRVEPPEAAVASACEDGVEMETKVPGSYEVSLPASASLLTPPPTPPLVSGPAERRERKPLCIMVPPSARANVSERRARGRGRANAVERC